MTVSYVCVCVCACACVCACVVNVWGPMVYYPCRAVVLNLGSIEPQGFVESVSGVRQRTRILRLFSTIPFFAENVKTFIHKHFKTYSFFSNIYHGSSDSILFG